MTENVIIDIVKKGKIDGYFYVKLSNGRLFYSDSKKVERDIKEHYGISIWEVDRVFPEEYKNPHWRERNEKIIDIIDITEEERESLYQKFPIRKGETILELGAYYGFSSIRLSELVGEHGSIISVEGSKRNYIFLEKNLDINEVLNVYSIRQGIWSSTKRLTLFDAEDERKSFIPGFVENDSGETIEVTTVDEILGEIHLHNNTIDVVLIDLNGSELEALIGMSDLIYKDRPRFIINCYIEESAFQVSNFLREQGYKIYLSKGHRVYALEG